MNVTIFQTLLSLTFCLCDETYFIRNKWNTQEAFQKRFFHFFRCFSKFKRSFSREGEGFDNYSSEFFYNFEDNNSTDFEDYLTDFKVSLPVSNQISISILSLFIIVGIPLNVIVLLVAASVQRKAPSFKVQKIYGTL